MLPSAEQEQTLQSLKMMNESMGLYGNLSLETILRYMPVVDPEYNLQTLSSLAVAYGLSNIKYNTRK
ncbi:MAG: hypothetical protein WCL07_04275 [bacterium]